MVGGLVQDQEVDLLVHEHAQPQPGLLPAGQGGDRLEYVLPPELEGGQPVAGGLGGAVQLIEHGVQQAALRVVEVDDLGQVAALHRGAHADLPLVGPLLPHQDLDEGGFAGAVVPQQGAALAPHHLQVHPGEQGALAEGFGQPLDGEHLIPPELPLPEADLHLPLPGGPVGGPHPLDALLHGLGPLEDLVVARIGPDPQLLGGLLQLLDLGLLLLILLQLLLVAALLLHHIEAVIAGVELRLPLLDLDDPVHHPVQEPAVVGDRQHRALELVQILLQPLGGLQVQVVGGLVQQQDVGVLQDQPAQVHPGLLPAGEPVEELFPHPRADLKAAAHLVLPGVGVIAAPGLEGGGELVVPAQQGGVLPPLHPGGQLLHLLLHLPQGAEGGVQYILHRVAGGVDRDLGDQAHPLVRGQDHLPLVPVQLAGEDAQQGGLAAAVLAQQSHPLAGVHLKGEPVQYFFADLKFLDQAGNGDIDHNGPLSLLCWPLGRALPQAGLPNGPSAGGPWGSLRLRGDGEQVSGQLLQLHPAGRLH